MGKIQRRWGFRAGWRFLLPVVAVLMAGVRPCAALQYMYAPNIFEAEPYYDSSSEPEPGDAGFSFRLQGGGKVTGDTWFFVERAEDGSEVYEDHHFRGQTIGKAVVRVDVDPRKISNRTQGIVAVPSSRRAFVRMKSPEGIVISGVFESSLQRPKNRYAGYPSVNRIHVRFHGTISNPGILGFKSKTFTLTRTYYLDKSYLSYFYHR